MEDKNLELKTEHTSQEYLHRLNRELKILMQPPKNHILDNLRRYALGGFLIALGAAGMVFSINLPNFLKNETISPDRAYAHCLDYVKDAPSPEAARYAMGFLRPPNSQYTCSELEQFLKK